MLKRLRIALDIGDHEDSWLESLQVKLALKGSYSFDLVG